MLCLTLCFVLLPRAADASCSAASSPPPGSSAAGTSTACLCTPGSTFCNTDGIDSCDAYPSAKPSAGQYWSDNDIVVGGNNGGGCTATCGSAASGLC